MSDRFETTPRSDPARWHRAVAAVVGDISFAIGRRKMGRAQLEEWAGVLETVAKEMRAKLEGGKGEA